MTVILALLASFWAVVLAAFVVLRLLGRRRRLRRRLQGAAFLSPAGGAAAADEAPEAILFRSSAGRSRRARLLRAVEARYPLLDVPRTAARAIGVGIAAAVAAWVSMQFLRIPSGWWTAPLVALGGVGGMWYAMAWLHARRAVEFTRQFPEIIDQIVRLSGAGLPPLEAIPVAAEDAREPVKPVLQAVVDGLNGGLDPETALRSVARRVRLTEFTLFASVILLQRRSGGGVSSAFATLSGALRERRSTGLKAVSATAQTRLTLLVLALMPPAVLAFQTFNSPESVKMLFDTAKGATVLHWGVGLIAAGLLGARAFAARIER